MYQEKITYRGLLTDCNARNCPVWKRLMVVKGILLNEAIISEDGVVYKVYWERVEK